MSNTWIRRLLLSLAGWLLMTLAPTAAQAGPPASPLVDAAWLQARLGDAQLVLLDASPQRQYAAGHIPGALNVDVFMQGGQVLPQAEAQARLRALGISPGKTIVVYDQGGFMVATRLFYELYHHGLPTASLFLLDRGLAGWRAAGQPVSTEAVPAPAPGSIELGAPRAAARVQLPAFLAASGDPARHALVEALEPAYYFGQTKFFDRAGHVPHALLWQSADFYRPDGSFKSAEELQRVADHLGIRREQQVHTYCGGGVAASVAYFALKFILGYPEVSLYSESQREWLQDERGLPMWSYAAPYLARDLQWLAGWNSPMLRAFRVAPFNLLDVRPAALHAQGHVPYALNLPIAQLQALARNPQALANALAAAGVDPAHETVIMAQGGVTPESAQAFALLERLGLPRVSILLDSADDWALGGQTLSQTATRIGAPQAPGEVAVPPVKAALAVRPNTALGRPLPPAGPMPRVYLAVGALSATLPADANLIRLPYRELLDAQGRPRPAGQIWSLLEKAGLPRHAEIISSADDAGEAAVGYYILRLMGYADVKLLPG